MAASSSSLGFAFVFMMFVLVNTVSSRCLSPMFYQKVCPQALPTIKKIVEDAVEKERRMGASLLRLHFHDCFVNGCDASVLLDDTANFVGEKTAIPNANFLRGFEVIDRIKSAVDEVCGRPVVSCADILAVAARDSVVALGGPTWVVQLGRRDSTMACQSAANTDIPSPFLDLNGLTASFKKQGLGPRDLVALSGGHTIGFSRCALFRNRIYNKTNIDPSFIRALQASCPRSGGDNNVSPLDSTPARFDVNYFKDLVGKRGLLHTDQVLFNGGSTDGLVKSYSLNPGAFSADFARSMVNMGNIKPLLGNNGQIRKNCRKVN